MELDGENKGAQLAELHLVQHPPFPLPSSSRPTSSLPASSPCRLISYKWGATVAAMNMFMPSPLQAGCCDVRGRGSMRKASSPIIKALGSESLCLHQLFTQSGLWPTSTERSEWKWTRRWSDSVVERECVWERVIVCVLEGRAQRPIRCLDNEEALLDSLWSHYFWASCLLLSLSVCTYSPSGWRRPTYLTAAEGHSIKRGLSPTQHPY